MDLIVEVSPAWDEFAHAAGAPLASAAQVLGHPLWGFIADLTSRQLYAQLLRAVRGGAIARFALRCDGPGMRRKLAIAMTALGPDRVVFRIPEVSAEPPSSDSLVDRRAA